MKELVYIRQLDDVDLKLECSDAVNRELSDYFSFKEKGVEFHPLVKARKWDGVTRIFSLKTGKLYTGLIKVLLEFCKERGYEPVVDKSVYIHDLKKNDITQFSKKLNLSSKGTEIDLRDYQVDALNYALTYERGLVVSPTGCHTKGTKVIMSDGSTKNVEDIKVGDSILGTDGTNRKVLKLCRGKDEVYSIRDISKRNSPRFKEFEVNGEHVLSLINTTTKKIINITVNEYLGKSKWFRHTHKLYSNDTAKEFNREVSDIKIDPYFIGLYIGDGSQQGCSITTIDQKIKKYIFEYISKNYDDLKVREAKKKNTEAVTYYFSKKIRSGKPNRLVEDMTHSGYNHRIISCDQKFIPNSYKYSSVSNRLKLLAGLIDSDGHCANGSYYEIASKSNQLVYDIDFVSRSLGFSTRIMEKIVNNTKYLRINIYGKGISKIPCMLKRKIIDESNLNRNKSYTTFGFDVELKGEDDYYGFELDGNNLYFLDNWIVTHNSGKSLVAFTLAMKWLTRSNKKILIIVPNLSLIHQLYDDFKDYSSKNAGIDIDRLVHKVYEGQEKNTDKPIIISTWQSIYNEKKPYFKQFDSVIVDEVHLAEAKSIRGIMTKLSDCPRRIGLTGTLKDSKCHRIILTGLFGPDRQVIKTKKLMDRGELAELKIECLVMKHKNAPKIQKYQDEMEYIVTHEGRNKFLVDLTCRCKGNTLVLCQYVEKHTIPLYEALSEKHTGNVYLVYGDIDGEEREWIRKTVETEKNAIIVATSQTFSTGVNIKNLHNVVFASPSKSKIRILQSIGRGLRTTENKTSMKLYDIADSFDSAKNYTMNHLEERIQIYAEQGFEYTIKEIVI